MIKNPRCDNTANNMVFGVFFCYLRHVPVRFHFVFLPSTLASLPPEIMFCMHLLKDSATVIEKVR